ncbi:MAG TPA: PaaI family thioesterase [Leptospiraceae bacterium]|nr:PaaI family thioesterase [Leptospiraceae bacterium]HMW05403.1 PaaI family thioesterase [Leptospiraceae bacterium]HMX32847.1 PaaI family thioesterase [Leptospiraceae bacterium]HMY33887.1 PaaI family thioesterase [Leptospiraceae bacterium]HMZ64505.1 PaaI family thioesterase [Leptospiraceae bacterium]
MKDKEEYKIFFESHDALGKVFGAKFISITEEECIYEYEVSKNHFNPNGTLHGGALFSVMDSCQGAFFHYIVDDIYKFGATGTASIRYLAPITGGKIKIKTWLKEKVRRRFILLSTAYDESGKEVATLEEIWIGILK